MLNKKYIPSFGFLILLSTIICTMFFVNWAFSPLSYEKAQMEESKGHQLAKIGKNSEASEHFLNAAKIEDDNINTSRRYRCAGTTALNEKDKIKYYQLALKYNPKNKNAKEELSKYFQEIKYIDRYADGWSIGKSGKVKINAITKNKYSIKYFTSSPENKEFVVSILLNNEKIETKTIRAGNQINLEFWLNTGINEINININHTFNPKELKMSTDNRDLGVHYFIKNLGNVNE